MMNLESLKGNKTLVRNLIIGGVVAMGLAGYALQESESTRPSSNNARPQNCCAFPNGQRGNQPRFSGFDPSANASDGWGDQMPQTDVSGYENQGYDAQNSGANSQWNGSSNDTMGGVNSGATNGSIEQPYNQFNDPDYIKSQENRHQMERDILGGTSTFVDPNSGQQYQMDSSTSNAWADQSGNTVGSDTSATQPDSSFTALTPLETNTGTSTDTSATTTDTTGQ
jgi:hypothetical protein